MSEDFTLTADNYAEFWGTKVESHSPTDLEEDVGILIIMACIDINEDQVKQESSPATAALWLEKGNDHYQVCQLSKEWRQQPLNLFFEEKLGVRFFVVGNASIYVYGYCLKDLEKKDRLRSEAEDNIFSASSNSSPLGKYSRIIDTTCYTISDDSKGSGHDSELSYSSSTSNSKYTSESTTRSVSLGSSTSCESPVRRKKKSRKKNDIMKD